MRERPAFIPPHSPRPLLDFTTLRDIGRSLIYLGQAVARDVCTMAEARDLAVAAYVRLVWDGEDVRLAIKVCDRIEAALERHALWASDWLDREPDQLEYAADWAALDDEARAWEMARAWDGVADEDVRGR